MGPRPARWYPSCYRPSDPVAHSDHPLGKACDAPPGTYGTLPTAAQKAAGAAQTGVHYLIWYGRIWNADRAHEGWRPYRGAGVYNTTPTTPDGITGGHYDHVHISATKVMSSDYLTNLYSPSRACTRCCWSLAALCRLVAAERCLLRVDGLRLIWLDGRCSPRGHVD